LVNIVIVGCIIHYCRYCHITLVWPLLRHIGHYAWLVIVAFIIAIIIMPLAGYIGSWHWLSYHVMPLAGYWYYHKVNMVALSSLRHTRYHIGGHAIATLVTA